MTTTTAELTAYLRELDDRRVSVRKQWEALCIAVEMQGERRSMHDIRAMCEQHIADGTESK